MPAPPYASGIGAPRKPELGHPREDLAMDLALLVPLADVRQDLGLGERPRRCRWTSLFSSVSAKSTIAASYAAGAGPTLARSRADTLGRWTPPRNLTPVLGRYFQREWSHGEGHRLFDTDGKAYLDFANGIAVTALGHAHPRVTAAIHAQVDQLIGPIYADRLHRADLAPRDGPRGDVPRRRSTRSCS